MMVLSLGKRLCGQQSDSTVRCYANRYSLGDTPVTWRKAREKL